MDYLRGRLRSISFALQGLKWLVRTQPNARIHTVATVLVVFAGWYADVSLVEWALLLGAIGAVWTAEALNTAIEWAIDLISPGHHPLAGKAKDAAAAGVFIASVMSMGIGILVFYPHMSAFF
jgi:diacylglycerol kinase (ATP)